MRRNRPDHEEEEHRSIFIITTPDANDAAVAGLAKAMKTGQVPRIVIVDSGMLVRVLAWLVVVIIALLLSAPAQIFLMLNGVFLPAVGKNLIKGLGKVSKHLE